MLDLANPQLLLTIKVLQISDWVNFGQDLSCIFEKYGLKDLAKEAEEDGRLLAELFPILKRYQDEHPSPIKEIGHDLANIMEFNSKMADSAEQNNKRKLKTD